jgi:hypothetical protein
MLNCRLIISFHISYVSPILCLVDLNVTPLLPSIVVLPLFKEMLPLMFFLYLKADVCYNPLSTVNIFLTVVCNSQLIITESIVDTYLQLSLLSTAESWVLPFLTLVCWLCSVLVAAVLCPPRVGYGSRFVFWARAAWPPRALSLAALVDITVL